MVLVQLFLEQTLTQVNFPVNLMGRYKCKITGLTYVFTGAAGTHEFLELRSSVLNFPYTAINESLATPNARTYNRFIFTNQSNHMVFTTGDAPEIFVNLNGYIDLYLSQLDSSLAPTNFLGLILTLDLEQVDLETDKVNFTRGNNLIAF